MQMPETPAVIAGEIVSMKPAYERRADGEFVPGEGRQVGVFSDALYGQKGATEVLFSPQAVASLRPEVGQRVALVVRYRAKGGGDNSRATAAADLVGPVTAEIIQALQAFAPASSAKAA